MLKNNKNEQINIKLSLLLINFMDFLSMEKLQVLFIREPHEKAIVFFSRQSLPFNYSLEIKFEWDRLSKID